MLSISVAMSNVRTVVKGMPYSFWSVNEIGPNGALDVNVRSILPKTLEPSDVTTLKHGIETFRLITFIMNSWGKSLHLVGTMGHVLGGRAEKDAI